jgi:molybdenum cofactor cytidylyltransferase
VEVAALVLAAGGSSRMGSAKQLLEVDGRSLVRRATDAALQSRCASVRVVTGCEADRVAAEVVGTGALVVRNAAWRDGLSASIAAGVSAATADAQPDGILVLLGDQPHVDSEVLDALLAAFSGEPDAIAACAYAGRVGVPAVFGGSWFAELRRLSGDRGARDLLQDVRNRVRVVAFEAAALDIDTPEDWASYLASRDLYSR